MLVESLVEKKGVASFETLKTANVTRALLVSFLFTLQTLEKEDRCKAKNHNHIRNADIRRAPESA